MVRCLNGSNVRVDQDGVDVALLERFDGLRTCAVSDDLGLLASREDYARHTRVIEFSGLTDTQSTTTDHQDLLDVRFRQFRQDFAGDFPRELRRRVECRLI
jgi:hypothetical protein